MKWMIASDLHGSAYYCKLLMQRWAEEQADTFLFLGDILYHGPRNDLPRDYAPKEVIAMLNPLADKLLCVRGNCDCEVDQMVLQFPILADYAVLAECGRRIYLTHGHVINKDHPLPFAEGDILLHGHTHVPVCEDCGTFRYLNPGSVSIPKNGSRHSYMTLENGQFLWKDVTTGEPWQNWSL